MSKKYSNQELKKKLLNVGLKPLDVDSDMNLSDKILCIDSEGYYVYANYTNLRGKTKPRRFHLDNPYTIQNINHWAELNDIKARCASDKYLGVDAPMKFKCECGAYFYTTYSAFKSKHKTKCDKCTGSHFHATYDEIKSDLASFGYYLDISENEFTGITTCDLNCHDSDGYKYKVEYCNVMIGKRPAKFYASNPFTIYNINLYLKSVNCEFECISEKYINARTNLEFVCKKCGTHVFNTWFNVNRNSDPNRSHVCCPNCGGRVESIHAIILKQMFKHYYPDTIEEDPSIINPKTGKYLPTDIVNHRLKIAIEVQSHWHDLPDKIEIDKFKKQYWIDRGYDFYDPDIRDYSPLEMCQLFFDIDDFPDWIDFDKGNKLNIKLIQDKLNSGMKVQEISKELNINVHRIYDALGCKKLKYPDEYSKSTRIRIVKLTINYEFIKEYESCIDSDKDNGFYKGKTADLIRKNQNFYNGYYWFKKDDYKLMNI